MAAKSIKIYIFELFAPVSTVFRLRGEFWWRKVILFAGDEAACADLSKGAARRQVALMLVCTLWARAAQYNVSIWTERILIKVNPADLPSMNRELLFPTKPTKELASIDELVSIIDLTWMFQQTN